MKIYIICFLVCLSGLAQNFTEEEVSIGEIRGTLSIPQKKTKTAILLISGSGPTDRDGNNPLGVKGGFLKEIAQNLAEEGFAVLRYDKRGIAASSSAVHDPKDHRFDHLIDDAIAWLDFLRSRKYKNLLVVGHSQGSLVGMVASQGRKDVKAFISLAGISDDAGSAVVRQLGAQSPELAESARIALDSMQMGYTVKKYNILLASLFGPQIQPFLKSYIAFNPSEEIQKLDIPVLLINGTTDLQVRVDDAKALKAVFPSAELLIIEGMNHILKDAPANPAENVATYARADLPLSNGLMDGIMNFIKKL